MHTAKSFFNMNSILHESVCKPINITCVTCSKDIQDDIYIIPVCMHEFHKQCLLSWFRSGKCNCPRCPEISKVIKIQKLDYIRHKIFENVILIITSISIVVFYSTIVYLLSTHTLAEINSNEILNKTF